MSNTDIYPPNNGKVLNTAQIIKAVMSSRAEAEVGTLFLNAEQATPTRQTLLEMGHPQPPMLILKDNSMAFGMVTYKIIPKATNAMDMHFDHEQQ